MFSARVDYQKKSAKGDPAAQHLAGESIENFVGEEAPGARAGPRSPDAFIGARRPERSKIPTDKNEMLHCPRIDQGRLQKGNTCPECFLSLI